MNWVQVVLDNIKALLPWRIIDADQQGLRFILGKHVQLLAPGIHLFCPGFMRIEAHETTERGTDTSWQSVETTDGVGVDISGNIRFRILDVRKCRLTVFNFEPAMERECRIHIADVVAESKFEDIRGNKEGLEESIHEALQEVLDPWGVEIIRVGITDIVRAIPLKLIDS